MGFLEFNRTNIFLFLGCSLVAFSGYYVHQRFAPFNMDNTNTNSGTVQSASSPNDDETIPDTNGTTQNEDKSDYDDFKE